MGFCFSLKGHGATCIGSRFAQVSESGFGLTEASLTFLALIAASVIFFVILSPSQR